MISLTRLCFLVLVASVYGVRACLGVRGRLQHQSGATRRVISHNSGVVLRLNPWIKTGRLRQIRLQIVLD